MIKVLALAHPDFAGDNANALGMQAALAEHYEQQGVPVETTATEEELAALTAGKALPDRQYVILGAGQSQLAHLEALKQPNVMTVWSGHQPAPELLEKSRALDVVHLPEYAVTAPLRTVLGHRLVTSPHGVPHSLTENIINTAYGKLAPSLPPAGKFLLVMLGGDTPPDGTFSPQEAFSLGQQMGNYATQQEFTLIGTNGPRTGGVGTHEPGMPLDEVSKSFLDGVNTSGLAAERQQFHPFVRGEESAYKGLLGAVKSREGSIAVLPGDSASMLTEAIDMLPLDSVAAYPTQAMQEIHHKQLKTVAEKGYATVAGFPAVIAAEKPSPAAKSVAEHIGSLSRQQNTGPVR